MWAFPVDDVVLAAAVLALLAINENVIEVLRVAGSLPDIGVHEDAGV